MQFLWFSFFTPLHWALITAYGIHFIMIDVSCIPYFFFSHRTIENDAWSGMLTLACHSCHITLWTHRFPLCNWYLICAIIVNSEHLYILNIVWPFNYCLLFGSFPWIVIKMESSRAIFIRGISFCYIWSTRR